VRSFIGPDRYQQYSLTGAVGIESFKMLARVLIVYSRPEHFLKVVFAKELTMGPKMCTGMTRTVCLLRTSLLVRTDTNNIHLLVRLGSDRSNVGPGRNRLLRTGPYSKSDSLRN
jgi:hypothetical protein